MRSRSILVLLLLVCAALPSAAQVLLSEPFDDGVPVGWAPYLSGWSESSGVYHATNTAPNVPVESVWHDGFGWKDYAVEADVRLLVGNAPADAELMLRYRSALYVTGVEDNCKCALFQFNGTWLYLDVPGQPRQMVPFPYSLNQWYRLRATAAGQKVTCEVAGHPETRMTSMSHGSATGTIGLRGTHIPADFDNVTVTALNQSGRLVFQRGGNIWIMNTDGSNQAQLTTGGADSAPRMKNGVVTFRRGAQLYRTDSHGAAPAAIPNTASMLEYDLSPDATELALTYISNNNFDLWRMNIDGTNKVSLSSVPGWHQLYPLWAENGFVYFGQAVFGNPFTQSIWRIPSAGGTAEHIVNYFSQYPAFAGSANRPVFLYNQPSPRLRSMRPDGTDQTDVPNSPSGIPAAPTADNENGIIYYYYAGQIWRLGLDGSGQAALAAAAQDHVDFGLDSDQAADTTPPQLTVPNDLHAEATSPSGAAVSFTTSATDIVDGTLSVTCTPSSGSTFPLGSTTVHCSATDHSGNVAAASFLVIVADTTAPLITVPNDLHAEATSPFGAAVSFTTSATDIVDGALSVTCTPPSGSIFPLGSTTVHCSASDHSGNIANASFLVIVADTTAPLITSVTATPSVLWPPNSKMVAVTVRVTAADVADPAFTAKIVGVSSDQPVGSEPDLTITGPLTLQLRAKRNGSGDRTYTIIAECRDHAGNVSTGRVTVVVPHDQGQ